MGASVRLSLAVRIRTGSVLLPRLMAFQIADARFVGLNGAEQSRRTLGNLGNNAFEPGVGFGEGFHSLNHALDAAVGSFVRCDQKFHALRKGFVPLG